MAFLRAVRFGSDRRLRSPFGFSFSRKMSSEAGIARKRGLILGAYENKESQDDGVILSAAAKKFVSNSNSNLTDLLRCAGPRIKKGKSRIFYGLVKEFDGVAVVGLGPPDATYNDNEEIDEARENIRAAVAEGARQLRDVGCNEVSVDPCGDACAAAEGVTLSLFSFDELKSEKNRKKKVTCSMYGDGSSEEWQKGILLAEGQNFARRLMDMPSNILTPTRFATIASETLQPAVEVVARPRAWIEDQKMYSFLSVTKGSKQEPVFLELNYRGSASNDPPVVLVGKGITFDSGGISLKPAKSMDKMRADMGGGACAVAAIHTAAQLRLPINIIGLVPLCENMPGGQASRPGDVVTAMNGKSIQIDNTDAEGRLILADALHYAHKFEPLLILDMATLTGSMQVALGAAAAGTFTNSTVMWNHLQKAGIKTGDRVWRMPLFEHYGHQMRGAPLADLNNIGGEGAGGCCTAAAFLKEFVTARHWLHLDIAGVMHNSDQVPYLSKGMAGRPTRTIVEFLNTLANLPVSK